MASSDLLKRLLRDACLRWHEEVIEPAIEVCFRTPMSQNERSRRAVSIHHWVSVVSDSETVDDDRELAWEIVAELMSTPTKLLHEIVSGRSRLLPTLPKALDGSPLHSDVDGRGRHRFGVIGGNTMTTTGDVIKDMRLAIARLAAMNVKRPLSRDERLCVICHPSLTDWFLLVHGAIPFSIDVVEFELLTPSDPWIICRDAFAVIKIGSPSLLVEVKDDTVGLGARFSVWLDDPANSVRIGPRLVEEED